VYIFDVGHRPNSRMLSLDARVNVSSVLKEYYRVLPNGDTRARLKHAVLLLSRAVLLDLHMHYVFALLFMGRIRPRLIIIRNFPRSPARS
jgi:hypothetical protein